MQGNSVFPDTSSPGLLDRSPSQGGPVDPEPLIRKGRNWPLIVGPAISCAIFVTAVYQLRNVDFASLWALLPVGIGFWLICAIYYLAAPVSEFVIFRRLWSLPLKGFPPLLGKLVSNEILLGYLGELYFYTWARRNSSITTAPFGAIKDVSILSALTGNIFTLALVLAAAPLLSLLHLHISTLAFVGSTVFVLLTSMLALLFRKHLFTLPHRELWVIGGIHTTRIVLKTGLAAAMWHIMLPAVPLGWWLLLAALRQLLSRLPFLPNKDVVFAGMAAFFVGQDAQIVDAMTLMASIMLAIHLCVGVLVGGYELIRESRGS